MKYVWCLVLALWIGESGAQSRLNFGEAYPQGRTDLPKSKVPFQKPERKPKRNEVCVPERKGEAEYFLRTGWELAEAQKLTASGQSVFDLDLNTKNWYNATVPGTVLTTLVNEGVYPDPYWGLNNLAIPDSLCRTDWWYRLVFEFPAEQIGKRCFIVLDGINYRAEIWLNGVKLGRMDGAFVQGKFDATGCMKTTGKNVLAVRILPPSNPGIPQEQNGMDHGNNGGVLCLDGPTFICTEGWDWIPGIRDRNIGLWQDVRLVFTGAVVLEDIRVMTDLPLPDTTRADLYAEIGLVNREAVTKRGKVELSVNDGVVTKDFVLEASAKQRLRFDPTEFAELRWRNPRLWWPNGYGNPCLYEAEVRVWVEDRVSDCRKIRFGVRELEYELTVDAEDREDVRILFNPQKAYAAGKPVIDNLKRRKVGNLYFPSLKTGLDAEGITVLENDGTEPYLVVRVNGKRIFCKGGNWGMDDAMKRVARERMEPYMRLHREQGFNMIRNWTAESTEEVFYDLCDEYGILVFNDFSMSTEGINLLPADFNLLLENIRQIVVRHRNHPSIALWCPRNEGFAPGYLENGISDIIARLDGTRHYIGNSRTMNTIKSGPWQYTLPVNYFKMAAGFANEVGSPSLPTAESVRKMMAEEDLWPIGDVWYYHDWLMGKWGDSPLIQGYQNGINRQLGESSGVDEFCRKAQLLNYESYRAIFEGWNSKLFGSATGVLLWMSHPAWPSMVWQTYSWDYETPGAYFGAKKACEPLHVQWNPLSRKVEVVNASLREYKNLTAKVCIYDLKGKKLWEERGTVQSASNRMCEVFVLEEKANWPEVYFIRLELRAGKQLLSENFYWETTSRTARDFTVLNRLPVTRLTGRCRVREENGIVKARIIVENPTDKVALAVKLNVRDKDTGKAVLPAYFSDGYFTLLPFEKKEIGLEFTADGKNNRQITAEGYNVRLQELSDL